MPVPVLAAPQPRRPPSLKLIDPSLPVPLHESPLLSPIKLRDEPRVSLSLGVCTRRVLTRPSLSQSSVTPPSPASFSPALPLSDPFSFVRTTLLLSRLHPLVLIAHS
jgi:hypothetical protein